jgi:hypothetical protein
MFRRTSLGEEGAEAVIRLGRLALLGEITIGLKESASVEVQWVTRREMWTYLDTVFEAVKL